MFDKYFAVYDGGGLPFVSSRQAEIDIVLEASVVAIQIHSFWHSVNLSLSCLSGGGRHWYLLVVCWCGISLAGAGSQGSFGSLPSLRCASAVSFGFSGGFIYHSVAGFAMRC